MTNQKKENTFKNQWELKVKTTKLPEVQENAEDQVVIDFCFASDWLREWCEFSGPITEGSKVKTKQPITFGLLWIENCFINLINYVSLVAFLYWFYDSIWQTFWIVL